MTVSMFAFLNQHMSQVNNHELSLSKFRCGRRVSDSSSHSWIHMNTTPLILKRHPESKRHLKYKLPSSKYFYTKRHSSSLQKSCQLVKVLGLF